MEALLTAASAMKTEQPVPFTEHLQAPSRMELDKSDGLVVVPDGACKAAEAQPCYAPQFSTANSFILNRMKNGTKALPSVTPTGFGSSIGDSRGGINTQPTHHVSSTLVMPSSRQPGLGQSISDVSDIAKRLIHSYSPSLKRKRSADAAGPDFTQSTIPFRAPIVPAPAAPASAPPQEESFEAGGPAKCFKCDQSTWAPENIFFTCRGCSKSWHQSCLTPIATDGAAKDTIYLCQECEAGNKVQTGSDNAGVQDRGHLVDRIRSKRISHLPPGVVPAKPELVGFLARQASSSERTEYFHNKKRTDLLNILSLCDQLKPQLLVDILVSVSKKHPDLPIYDDPDWRANLPSASGPKRSATTQRSRITGRPRHGHTLVHPKASRKVKGSRKVLKRITVMKAEDADADAAPAGDAEDEDEGEEDSLPPTWPKAGEGLYAKLPPEDEDRAFLEDDNDEEAFSHFMVDKFGKQMAVPACA